MVKAKSGDLVKVHYTGKLDDGSVFDSSSGNDPLEFTIGSGQILPKFKEAVIGVELGRKDGNSRKGRRCLWSAPSRDGL